MRAAYLAGAVLILFFTRVYSRSSQIGNAGEERFDVATLKEFTTSRQKLRGLLVVPGVGRADRLQTLVQSLRLLYPHLKGEAARWDCVVYIYAPRTDAAFWDDAEVDSSLKYVRSVCDIVEHPNKRITENLRLVQPALIRKSYTHVFILFDDCKLTSSSQDSLIWDLDKLLDVMAFNRLNVASPRVENANKGGGQDFRKIMFADPVEGIEGYVSVFVEMFAWVMKVEAYESLWELLLPEVNPYGWGYDFWYNNYAKYRAVDSQHKMGIVTSVTTVHDQSLAPADDGKAKRTSGTIGRAESAGVKEKWEAVKAQERYFKKYHGYDIGQAKINLSNSSWNGAIVGYLHTVPLEYLEAASRDRLVKSEFGGGRAGGRPKNGFGRKGAKGKSGGKRGPGMKKRASMSESVSE